MRAALTFGHWNNTKITVFSLLVSVKNQVAVMGLRMNITKHLNGGQSDN